MDLVLLDRLTDKREQQVRMISELADAAAEAQDGDGRDLNQNELETIQNAEARIVELDAQINPIQDFITRSDAARQLDRRTARREVASGGELRDARSLGDQFIDSDQFRGFDGHGTSLPFKAQVMPWERRAAASDPILTTSTPGAGMVPPPALTVRDGRSPLYPLLDLIGRFPVSQTSVKWTVVEAATGADQVAEGDLKPFIQWTEGDTTHTLQTIAGVKKFSRQMLQDVPLFAEFINRKLRQALEKELNDEAVVAMAAGVSGTNTTTGATGVDLMTMIRGGISTLEGRGVVPNAIALNPADHAAIDLLVMQGTLNGPVVNNSVFGIPIANVPAVTVGSAVVGDFAEGLTWFQHTSGVHLYVTDSDISGEGATSKSDFRRNILTSLLETQALVAATDASALQKVVTTPSP